MVRAALRVLCQVLLASPASLCSLRLLCSLRILVSLAVSAPRTAHHVRLVGREVTHQADPAVPVPHEEHRQTALNMQVHCRNSQQRHQVQHLQVRKVHLWFMTLIGKGLQLIFLD